MAISPDTRLDLARMRRWPNMTLDNHRVTSCEDSLYNCIAWAYGSNVHLMWPGREDMYWPEGLPTDEYDPDTFKALFASAGFEECDEPSFERGYEKVAIYVRDGAPTHAARQLPSGEWTSKLGMIWEDISHTTVEAVGGGGVDGYGRVVAYMRRANEYMRGVANAP